jgi:thiamine-phosphate pyrophosphorylase
VALPRLLVVTDRRQSEHAGRPLVATVAAAVGAGARAVLLREKDLARAERIALAREVCAAVRAARALLLVASDVGLARTIGAAGVHLAADDHWPDAGAVEDLVVGRSCHSRDDVVNAALCGTAYVTLSPVHRTTSKPGYGPPLDLEGLSAGARAPGAPPVYALGGVGPGTAAPCLAAGATGVAVMGAVMGAPDPAAVVTTLLAELDTAAS